MIIEIRELIESLSELLTATSEKITSASLSVAKEIEAQAKRDAPWTDRTGMARATMEGFVQMDGKDKIAVGICGNMPYSPNLELWYGGRYSILVPTMDACAPELLSRIKSSIFGL